MAKESNYLGYQYYQDADMQNLAELDQVSGISYHYQSYIIRILFINVIVE